MAIFRKRVKQASRTEPPGRGLGKGATRLAVASNKFARDSIAFISLRRTPAAVLLRPSINSQIRSRFRLFPAKAYDLFDVSLRTPNRNRSHQPCSNFSPRPPTARSTSTLPSLVPTCDPHARRARAARRFDVADHRGADLLR